MKRLVFCAIALALLIFPATAESVFTSADSFNIVNKPYPEGPVFQRVDTERHPDLGKTLRNYYRYPTGMAVLFQTDSPVLEARWTTDGGGKAVNMPRITELGLDLYVLDGNKWIWAGVGKPKNDKTEHKSTIVKNMADTMKTCMLYLPLFTRLTSLEIGIDSAYTIKPAPNPWKKRIVAIGSSITHGTGVSRPGMAYPARIERMLGIEVCNLGASGQCKLESFFADVAADCIADAFIFDTFSNPDSAAISERLEPFVASVSKSHPGKPLIFLQTLDRETRNYSTSTDRFEAAKQKAAHDGMNAILKKYKDVYFIEPGMPTGDDSEGTGDGVHPSDLGHERILQSILPEIKKILADYGVIEL